MPATAPPASAAVVVAVAVGGAVGSCLRAAVGALAPASDGGWPWATFGVNVTGCALLALLPALRVVRDHHLLAPLLGTGLLGGFTTLSAWSAEAHALGEHGHPLLAAAYAVTTLVACLAAVALVDRWSTGAQRAAFDAREGDL